MALTKITSEQVVFKPDATGSVARKLTDVLSDTLNVKDFGAVSDFSYTTQTGTDNSAAFQAAINAAPEGSTIEIPNGYFRIASKLVATGKSLKIKGAGAVGTHLIFDNCDGFDINAVYGSNKGWRFEGLSFLSTANGTRTGIKYAASSGGGPQLDEIHFRDCNWMGADRINLQPWGINPNNNTCTWLVACDLIDADSSRFENCFMTGQERSFTDGWPQATIGIRVLNITSLTLENFRCYRYETGVLVTGQSEGLKMDRFSVVATRYGLVCQAEGVSNNHTIVNGHFSSVETNMSLNRTAALATQVSSFHSISNVFFLRRPEAALVMGFRHIFINGNRSFITNCKFASIEPGTDVIATGGVAIEIGGLSSDVCVTNNHFLTEATCVLINTGAQRSLLALNLTDDNVATIAVPAYVDNGTASRFNMNTGRRPSRTIDTATTAVSEYGSVAHSFLVGTNRNKALDIIQGSPSAVNYVEISNDATGAAAKVSAAGADTNVDLRLSGQGTGKVRFGTHVVNADAAITGYIEIKDASGVLRKLAIIN